MADTSASCCQSERTGTASTTSPDVELRPHFACDCGPRERHGWIVSADPRLTVAGGNWRVNTGRAERLGLASERCDSLVAGPEPPPPRTT